MPFMLSSSAAVDLWKVDVSELSDAGPNAPEHFWAVGKGYVAGFLTDAVSEGAGVRIVAALKSEYTRLLIVTKDEVRKASPAEMKLRWAANYWATCKGYGGGALILERKTGHCLIAATDKRFVKLRDVVGEVSSVHRHAVGYRDVITAFFIQRTGSGVSLLSYSRVDIEAGAEEDEPQLAAPSSMQSSNPATVPSEVEQERDGEEDGKQPSASSPMPSSGPAVELWFAPSAEPFQWEITIENQWPAGKGYGGGFGMDAAHEDEGVRLVATLICEHSQLMAVSTEEIREAVASGSLLLLPACNRAIEQGSVGGASREAGDEGACLVLATERGFVTAFRPALESFQYWPADGSCHQLAVAQCDAVAVFTAMRVCEHEKMPSWCVVLLCYRKNLEDDEEERQLAASSSMLSSRRVIAPGSVKQERDDDEGGQKSPASSSMLSSSAVVDLWKVDVSELSKASPSAPEHYWAVGKGYVAGFLADAMSDGDSVRIVAALKSEHTQLVIAPIKEIQAAHGEMASLRFTVNRWALSKGYGSGTLILERETGDCVVAATRKGCAKLLLAKADISSCHQYAVRKGNAVTACFVQRFTQPKEDGSGDYVSVLMIAYFGAAR